MTIKSGPRTPGEQRGFLRIADLSARMRELEAENQRLREANRRLQAEGPALERDRLIQQLRDDVDELVFCEDCTQDCDKLPENGCYPPRYCHACQQKLIHELCAVRTIVNAAVAGQIARHAYIKVNCLKPTDYDARGELNAAYDEAEAALYDAVTEYRKQQEAA